MDRRTLHGGDEGDALSGDGCGDALSGDGCGDGCGESAEPEASDIGDACGGDVSSTLGGSRGGECGVGA